MHWEDKDDDANDDLGADELLDIVPPCVHLVAQLTLHHVAHPSQNHYDGLEDRSDIAYHIVDDLLWKMG